MVVETCTAELGRPVFGTNWEGKMRSIKDALTSWYCEMSARFGPDVTGSDAEMAAIEAAYERLLELLGDEVDDKWPKGKMPFAAGGLDDSVEDSAADGKTPFGTAAGFALVSPSSIKLWAALEVLGDSALVTRDQLALRTGLEHKTLSRHFRELEALGWLSYRTSRGKGIWYKLHRPPAVLTPSAAAYYEDQIRRIRELCETRCSHRTQWMEESSGRWRGHGSGERINGDTRKSNGTGSSKRS